MTTILHCESSDNNFMKYTIAMLLTGLSVFLSGCSEDNPDGPNPPQSADYSQIDFEPSWSNSADRIAYVHNDLNPDNNGIYIVNSDGTGIERLMNGFFKNPDWLPGDSVILFNLDDHIYKVNINSKDIAQLTVDGKNHFPRASNDGRIAFVYTQNSVSHAAVMNSDGQQRILVEDGVSYVNWFNNNILVCFKPIRDHSGNQIGDTLISVNMQSGQRQVIAVLPADPCRVSMYPSVANDVIVFSSMDSRGYNYVYKIHIDGSNLTKLTSSTQGYSPDASVGNNQSIVYTNRSVGNGRLWLMDRDGQNKIQLTF